MEENRKKALSAALGQIEKQFGKGSVMRLGDAASTYDVEAVSTGSLGLDIHIHDHFVVVPVTVFLFWLSMGIAGVWLLFRVIRRTIAAKRVG